MNLNLNSRDRQEEIIRILRSSKQTTVSRLAAEFGVSVSTIYRDITALSHKFPITTQQGNGGGVFLVSAISVITTSVTVAHVLLRNSRNYMPEMAWWLFLPKSGLTDGYYFPKLCKFSR